MNDWKHKDEWKRAGKNFLIVVSRHGEKTTDAIFGEGPNRWAVYAYIYPAHPHFSKFNGTDMWQDAATCLPFHGYPSFLRTHFDDVGTITSIQVGADYHHIHDDEFTHFATKEGAVEVFEDADRLHASLTRMAEVEPVKETV